MAASITPSEAANTHCIVDQWVEKHVTFSDRRPKLSKPTGSSQSAYRHGRQDGARQAIGLKETGKVADWALEK